MLTFFSIRIVFTAVIATSLIFICFSASAILAPRPDYLYLGGLLSSALSMLCFLSIATLFSRSEFLVNVIIYFGLLVFSGYVVYDTTVIIEKFRLGRREPVEGALELLIDFVAIFVRILIALSKDKKK